MHDLYNLKDMLVDALCDYGKRDTLTQNSLELIDTLAHAAKNVCKVIEMCDDKDKEEYSFRRGRDRMGRFVSRDGTEMVHRLREMMEDAPDESVRSEIRHLIEKMERM